jgi:hypothetical protein
MVRFLDGRGADPELPGDNRHRKEVFRWQDAPELSVVARRSPAGTVGFDDGGVLADDVDGVLQE